jgi:hypothetical protein
MTNVLIFCSYFLKDTLLDIQYVLKFNFHFSPSKLIFHCLLASIACSKIQPLLAVMAEFYYILCNVAILLMSKILMLIFLFIFSFHQFYYKFPNAKVLRSTGWCLFHKFGKLAVIIPSNIFSVLYPLLSVEIELHVWYIFILSNWFLKFS